MNLDVPACFGPACAACGAQLEVLASCSRCTVQRYCGPECQKADYWLSHNLDCFDFRKLPELFRALPERIPRVGENKESVPLLNAFYHPDIPCDVSFLPPELQELWNRARKMWTHDLSWFPRELLPLLKE
jgi:hypothetical protein